MGQDKSFEEYKKEQNAEFKAYKYDYYAGLEEANNKFTEYYNLENERYKIYKEKGVLSTKVKNKVIYAEKLFPKELVTIPLKQSETKLIEIHNKWKDQLKNIKKNKKIKKENLVLNINLEPNKLENKTPKKNNVKPKKNNLKESTNKKELDIEIAANRPVFCPLPNNTYRISSRFKKKRKHPILKKVRKHEGIDLAAPKGTKIFSAADAVVTLSRYSKSAGNFIILNHNNGYTTTFMHLNKRFVKKGSTIKRGQLIGEVGSTGYSTGAHLHYEVRKNGNAYDPASFIIKHF